MPMFNIDSDTLVRIERSPYIGGHFYMRFKKNTQTMTLGFGYDEHHQETNPILKSPLITSIQLLHTIIHPVSEKWVIYKTITLETISYCRTRIMLLWIGFVC